MSKRILSVILLICMLVNNLPASAFAEESTSGCSHVCDEICGFAEEVACDKDCPAGEAHVEGCTYQPGSECTHQHNDQCGVACTHAYAEGVCAICGETEPQPQPCKHSGGEATCEVLAVCELCKESYGDLADHVYEEGKCACGDECEHTFAEGICTLCGMEEPETKPVCNCGTDDASIHATTCAVYAAPENPECHCVEKCLEANIWCDVCGIDYSLCGGTGKAEAYTDHKHCLSVHEDCTGHDDAVTWTAWEKTDSLPTYGDYYLTADVILSQRHTVKSGTLNLCLNGHTITPSGSGFGAIEVTRNLSLTDCQGNGKITGFTNKEGQGGAVYSKGTFTMYGGIISGNIVGAKYYTDSMGGGVYSEGTFTMYGGTISGNEAQRFGGGVYVASGKQFTMYGGTISGNKVTTTGNAQTYGGGGVYVAGNFTMSGGTISGNEAQRFGGGVCIGNNTDNATAGTFAMSGGKIIDNKAMSGGGVCIDSRKQFIMSGGTISGNTSSSYGGGVYVAGSNFTMSGGTISGNNAGSTGGGVHINTGATVNMTGGKITGNAATNNGGGVYMIRGNTKFNLSGSPIISGNTGGNCYIENNDNCFITVTGALGENARIGITTWSQMLYRPFCKPASSIDLSNYKNWFFSDIINHGILQNGDGSLYTEQVTTYALTFDSEKAKVTVRGIETTKAVEGDIVVISPIVPEGATVESVTATGCTVTDHGDGTYSFTMPASAVTITVTAAAVDPSTEITQAQTENGNFDVSCEEQNGKVMVTVTPAPAEGYEVDKVTYTPEGGTETEVIKNTEDTYAFEKPNGNLTVKVTFKQIASAGHTHSINGSSGAQKWDPISSLDEIQTDGYYCLEDNVTYSGAWTPKDGTVLCLNGHSIIFQDIGYVNVNNVSFTLTDCESDGKITGGTGYSNRGGGGVYIENGTFDMYGGKITGNTGSNGGGVYVRKGTFTMYGGEITGNSATSNGGGVWTYNSNTTKFYMYGGEITGNSSSYGDVFLSAKSQLTLSGSPVIGQVYIPNDAGPITIGSSGLQGNDIIGVKLYDKNDIVAVGADPNQNPNDYLNCFKCLNSNAAFGVVDNKIRVAAQERTVRFLVDSHGKDSYSTVELGKKVTKPADPTAPGYTFKGWYRDNDTFQTEWNFDQDVVTSDMLGTTPTDRDQFWLYAKWELNPAVLTTQKGYTGTYDRQAHTIKIEATHTLGNHILTYQWYRGADTETAKPIENATGTTLSVENVVDSGTYYCKVSADDSTTTVANNKLTSEVWSDSITVSISKADQAAPENLGYQGETIAQKADGKITGLDSTMEYKLGTETDYTPVTGTSLENLPAGTYHVRYQEQPNYKASEPAEVIIARGRMLTISLPDAPQGYALTVSGGGKAEAVYNGEIKLKLSLAEGYGRNESFRLTATNSTDVTEEYGIFTISGITDDVVVSVTGIVDVAFPTAEITVATNKWSSFLEDITFGIFFKETQTVTIDAQDAGSGVKTIEYYLSENAMSLDQVTVIPTWSGYNDSFSIDAEKQYVIFAKVTDYGDNTIYVNSNGIVMDKTAPIFSGVTDDNEYYTTQMVTVTETNLASLTCNGNTVTSPITLKGNMDTTYEIVATDRAGNSSQITVIMNPVEELSVPLPDDVTLELDDQNEIEELKANVNSLLAAPNVTHEEKAALQKIIDRCDVLLQIIADVKQVKAQIGALKAPAKISPDEIDVILAYDGTLEAYEKLTKRGKELVGTNELAKLEAVGKALTAYDVIKGHKSSYVKGSFKTISIVANGYYDVFGKYTDGSFGKFREVRIDGEILDSQYYTAASGSTVITLKPSYLESLETGKHYIQFVYVDGSTDGNDYFRVSVNNGSPMTGDNSHILMFTGMAVTSLLCAALMIVFFPRKKGKYER